MTATIWVIDDDRSIRWVLEKALSQEGFQLACFEDADEALNKLDEGAPEPDVLISDVRMPGTDGLRMLKILQRTPKSSAKRRPCRKCFAPSAGSAIPT